jgi:hypothetical protein
MLRRALRVVLLSPCHLLVCAGCLAVLVVWCFFGWLSDESPT